MDDILFLPVFYYPQGFSHAYKTFYLIVCRYFLIKKKSYAGDLDKRIARDRGTFRPPPPTFVSSKLTFEMHTIEWLNPCSGSDYATFDQRVSRKLVRPVLKSKVQFMTSFIQW